MGRHLALHAAVGGIVELLDQGDDALQKINAEGAVGVVDAEGNGQGQGVGAVLLRACLVDAANSGFRAVTLTTFRDVAWNGPFYSRIGFAEVEDLKAHPRLAKELAEEAAAGLPPERRTAMIHFL